MTIEFLVLICRIAGFMWCGLAVLEMFVKDKQAYHFNLLTANLFFIASFIIQAIGLK